jgi:hypothetical protein
MAAKLEINLQQLMILSAVYLKDSIDDHLDGNHGACVLTELEAIKFSVIEDNYPKLISEPGIEKPVEKPVDNTNGLF